MKLFKREKFLRKIRPFYHSDDIIKVITGVRRCGKSSLMRIIVEELLGDGVKSDDVLYVDLEKRGFKNLRTAESLDAYLQSKTLKSSNMKYVFVDEVQNISNFEETLNFYRSEGGYSIFITGSNSYLLSGEIATKLTGRYIEFEIFPYSFDEYLSAKRFYKKEVNGNLLLELNNFILEGGFPRLMFIDESFAKREYSASLVKEIFDKDIRKRVRIKNKETFENIKNFVIGNFGATMSVGSICESLEKGGVKITRLTVEKYIRALVDAKILYECSRFDVKSKKVLSGEKKYYVSDLSFFFSLHTDNNINYGPCLENLVYFYALSYGYSVSVGRVGKFECDFILRSADADYSYVQVAYTILAGKETEDREYRPLESIRDNWPKYVLTTDYLQQKRNGIKHLNLVELMANGEML